MTNEDLEKIKQERADKAKELNRIKDNAVKDKKVSKENSKKIDTIVASIEDLDSSIRAAEKIIDALGSQDNIQGNGEGIVGKHKVDPKNLKDFSARAEHADTLSDSDFHKLKMEVHIRGDMGGASAVLNSLPESNKLSRAIRADLSVGTATAGGITVPQELSTQIIEQMKLYGGLSKVATHMNSTNGRDMEETTTNTTGQLGERIAENANATKLDPEYGTITAKCYKYSSKIVAVSFELLQDTGVDIVGHVMRILGERLGRIVASEHITSVGAAAVPYGLLSDADVGATTATGNSTKIVYDDVIDLISSIDPAYRGVNVGTAGGGSQASTMCKFLMNDSTLNHLRKLKDEYGYPLFMPSANVNTLDMIGGYSVIIDQHMPSIAAGSKALAYGILSNFRIKNVIAPEYNTIFKLSDSKYLEKAQYGYLSLTRQGFRLFDNGGNTVKVLQQAAS